ncbi:glycoside hydrolase family 3 N-terminal domain-containing protein [Algoriphagus zhangzhouensis]|uniref:beta-N-acetylhexosaminidase n=1 Tax=Algoriphagus zhangzhouensis TaxID=1073327 RepID=A0A1M7ZGZ7_9BACT|nr:glycoside hydrolase family 3 N-terminal domain-containing protein [Algoriphagus zhangzhouensis]TDY44762.1 beta-glucosidase-like glycosyl hydrolase [Algoriphagus zhangzhouensis]SHO63946.1 beta-glucosidase [Algoriphagus zhangzhouensis]
MSKKLTGVFLLCCIAFFFTSGRMDNAILVEDPLIASNEMAQLTWVDSVFEDLTLDQRLGQLFMVAAYSNKDQRHIDEISNLVKSENLGGLIFFQGGPDRQARLTNYYQALSKTPLFIAMDAEWGISMRLDSIADFPKAMTLGAIQNPDLIYDMGTEMARQFRELGMHINFAPVVDVNSNPDNPVIGYRAFGENKNAVAKRAVAYMKGLQDHGVIANAKHFPGHGDTESDSHYALPVINHTEQKIWDVDLYPYQELIKEDLMSVMVAHLNIPSLDNTGQTPTSLSKKVVTDLLQKRMNFQGLIFTDALNMRGVAQNNAPGVVDVKALLAGNDVLLYSQDVPKAKTLIKQAIAEGKITEEEVNRRVKKILRAKYKVGLNNYRPIKTHGLIDRLNTPHTEEIRENLYSEAITVASNKGGLIPFKGLDLKKFASLTIGGDGEDFEKSLDKYAGFDHFQIDKASSESSHYNLIKKLEDYDVVVVGLMGITNSPKRAFGIAPGDVALLRKLEERQNVVTVLFGNAYASKFLEGLGHVVFAFENNNMTQNLTPQILFGGRPGMGILPVSVSPQFRYGVGGYLEGLHRLSYGTPESAGLDSKTLDEIDDVVAKAIRIQATPGANVLVVKDGKVVFERSYGQLEYKSSPKVNSETVYDLASITKVLATTQAVMFLASRGELDMNKTLGDYLPELKGTNKANLLLKDVMAHEAGLKAFIPHYVHTVESGQWRGDYYKPSATPGFTRPVSNDMFARDGLRDSIWNWTVKSDLLPKRGGRNSYVYSDLTMYFMQAVVEKLVNQPLDEFLEQNFYSPLGLTTMTFKPFEKMPLDNIAPTENDVAFRKRQVKGYVHDPGAAMYGGVAGHAGLFGKANDLAVMMQMLLNGGYYGDVTLLKPNIISDFTKRQSNQSRRGWGWDKPDPDKDKGGSAGVLAPKSTFGHTGFTGTCVWADPENDLIYVFLSNRVYPEAQNTKLLREGIRTDIHDIIYKAMAKK